MTDKFLGVGGTDGTNAHPLKMDVEGNLEVRDIDVKAELELIKDQQSEILVRLGEPIDTRLTGSNVELYNNEQISISAGSSLNILSQKVIIDNFSHFIFTYRLLDGEWRVLKTFFSNDTSNLGHLYRNINNHDTHVEHSEVIDKRSNHLAISFQNEGLESQIIRAVSLIGVI